MHPRIQRDYCDYFIQCMNYMVRIRSEAILRQQTWWDTWWDNCIKANHAVGLDCSSNWRLRNLTSQSQSSRRTPVVITEPFSDKTGPLRHVSKETGSDKQWNVCLQRHTDNVTYRWFLSADQTRRRSITSTRCRKNCCWLDDITWHL